jgi:hypothetical protein
MPTEDGVTKEPLSGCFHNSTFSFTLSNISFLLAFEGISVSPFDTLSSCVYMKELNVQQKFTLGQHKVQVVMIV